MPKTMTNFNLNHNILQNNKRIGFQFKAEENGTNHYESLFSVKDTNY